MNSIHSHINTAVRLIENYKGDLPLSHYLKQYFLQHKKHGSKDRKSISQLCYAYYRLGHALKDLPLEERLRAAVENPSTLFPWKNLLSEGIDAAAFEQSFLQQPDLFIRIRPRKEKEVVKKLDKAEVTYRQLNVTSIAFPNTTKIDSILEIDKEAVIQDLSSQRVGEFLDSARNILRLRSGLSERLEVWDCCAASGGKSIMAVDILGDVDLSVSDIRPSILKNLKDRFQKAGIKKYRSFIADLADPSYKLTNNKYDLIIADVPCTGSGTWARTPEQMYFFDISKMDYYRKLQESMVAKIIPALKSGGALLYITCSVFKKENEEMVDFIKKHANLKLDKMELLKGYEEKADSMFAAIFSSR